MAKIFGRNLFTHEGMAWKQSRSMIRPQCYLSQIADTDFIEKHVLKLCQKAEIGSDGWSSPLNIGALFHNVTLDVASEFLFGYSIFPQNPAARLELPKVEDMEAPDPNLATVGLRRATEWAFQVAPLGKWHWIVRNTRRDAHLGRSYRWRRIRGHREVQMDRTMSLTRSSQIHNYMKRLQLEVYLKPRLREPKEFLNYPGPEKTGDPNNIDVS